MQSDQAVSPPKPAVNLHDIFTISNLVTLSRLAFLPFIVYFLVNDLRYTALLFMAIMLISDALDGFLARKLNQVTETGKFLDPVCDKIALAVVLITLYATGSIPLWGVVIIVLRDVLILFGSFLLIRFKGKLFKSNVMGKITGLIFGLIICAFTIRLTRIGTILLYLCIPALIASFTIYLMRYINAMKGEL